MTDGLEAEVARLQDELKKKDATIKRKTELVHRLMLPADSAQVHLSLATDHLEYAREDLQKCQEREHEYAKAIINQGSSYRLLIVGALVVGVVVGYALKTFYDNQSSHNNTTVIEQPK